MFSQERSTFKTVRGIHMNRRRKKEQRRRLATEGGIHNRPKDKSHVFFNLYDIRQPQLSEQECPYFPSPNQNKIHILIISIYFCRRIVSEVKENDDLITVCKGFTLPFGHRPFHIFQCKLCLTIPIAC